MERRVFLQRSGLGLTMAAASGGAAPPAPRDVVNAADYGAVGDGVHDDTRALQAAIDFALTSGRHCYIPAGIFKTTAPLAVGDPASHKNYEAFRLFGAGKSAEGAGPGGTLIRQSASGVDAILRMEKNAWRFCEIRDMGLQCAEKNGAAYGILFNSTQFSAHQVDSVAVHGARTAFGIEVGTGANGEFTLFNNCYAWYVDTFFYNNAGEAYVQYFHHCGAALSAGGTHFDLASGSGGCGIDVVDYNGGAYPEPGSPANTTLVRNRATNSCLNFYGGRIETVTQLYANVPGGGANLHVTANFCGLQIVCDCDHTNPRLTKPAFIDLANAPDILTIDSCSFYTSKGRETLNVRTAAASAYVLFRGCHFMASPQPPFVTADYGDVASQVRFEDCRVMAQTQDDAMYGGRSFAFDRHSHHLLGAAGRRRAYSENAFIHSGRPVNLLAAPHFTARNGLNIAADPPWVHEGSASFDTTDWTAPGSASASSSPWSKLIVLRAQSGLYQDISALDLASPQVLYSYDDKAFHLVVYQAMIRRMAGSGSVRFALVDAAGGRVYDEMRFTNAGDNVVTRVVTLSANVMRLGTPSRVRLKIENDAAADLTIEFLWQLVAADEDSPAFAATPFGTAAFSQPWGLSTESGRFWHRLSLPYKDDRFGSGSARPLDDLQSDLYLSRSTEKVTHFANGAWWSAPRTTSAERTPTSGRWAQGDLVFNAAPVPGGALGWVQVTPGQFAAEHAWSPATAYHGGERVYCGRNVYDCVAAGVSASTGPASSENRIADGSCFWAYVGRLAAVACDRRWSPGTYRIGDRVTRRDEVYECIESGASRTAPRGDGTESPAANAQWRYLGPLAKFKRFGFVEK